MLYDQGQLAAAYSKAYQVRPPCPSVGCAQHPEFELGWGVSSFKAGAQTLPI